MSRLQTTRLTRRRCWTQRALLAFQCIAATTGFQTLQRQSHSSGSSFLSKNSLFIEATAGSRRCQHHSRTEQRHSKRARPLQCNVVVNDEFPEIGVPGGTKKSKEEGRGYWGRKKQVWHDVHTVQEMLDELENGTSLFDLRVIGDSCAHLKDRAEDDIHPVIDVLKERLKTGSKPGARTDNFKVGIAIEGGGMRGCISAGMIAAVVNIGVMDGFDAVYGSSAGSLVGAYAVAGQEGMPRVGCSVYYDTLTGKGRHFIDTRFLLRAMGLGLLSMPFTRKDGLKDLISDRLGSPVLKLDYLLEDVVERLRPLNWKLFWEKQKLQPMHIIASAIGTGSSVVLSSRGGHFSNLQELTACMRASMLLPGITGPMVTLPGVNEPLVDSQLYEPIPYRAALEDGCTHVLVTRSRPDGLTLIGKPKLGERMIAKRYFSRKHHMPEVYQYMKAAGHKKLYALDVLRLNEAAKAKIGDPGPHLLPISLMIGEEEVARLERRREKILEGVRKGYEQAHNLLRSCLPDDDRQRHLDGAAAALEAFPDEILDYNIDPVLATLPGYENVEVFKIKR